MLTRDLVRTAMNGLTRNISRSVLTTLGIMIGVGSVVLMISMGASFQKYILDQVSSFSGGIFEIHAKGLQEFGKETQSISTDDLDALSRLSTVESVAPVIFVAGKVRYGTEEITPSIFGSTKEIFSNFSLTVEHGRALTDGDIKGGQDVAVLGSKSAEDLFPSEDPLGKRITIGTRKFTVVGTLKSFGSPLMGSMDSLIYVPIS
ncbi:MAG: ABC transporter permease, partial [Candidatus Peribacteraceae bacterium]|nr:ABC transporter permease [Candidatus Peribacteraceae bacterium]